MGRNKIPVTAAIRVLRQHRVDFDPHLYDYEPRGGTGHSAACLGVDEHHVIKTLVMQDEAARPLVVLMHGDREVSTKALARQLKVKSITPCDPAVAERHSGYQVGGTSPFGTRKALPIYMQASIAALPRLYINGGKRGLLVSMAPAELMRVLDPTPVRAAIDPHGAAADPLP
ncbi:MAG: Cys-tRNA(Pro) deacylase [Myxococcota bacterium]